jgi:hypothetical protein
MSWAPRLERLASSNHGFGRDPPNLCGEANSRPLPIPFERLEIRLGLELTLVSGGQGRVNRAASAPDPVIVVAHSRVRRIASSVSIAERPRSANQSLAWLSDRGGHDSTVRPAKSVAAFAS